MKINNKRLCALVQATYISEIFPGKSMVKLCGKTVLQHIVERINKVNNVTDIILATSDLPEDDALAAEAQRLNIKVFRGSETDVVSRLCNAVEVYEGETILKVNGNYPLFDPHLASDLIKEHLTGNYDFSYNEHLDGTIYGTGCEVVSRKLLFNLNAKKLTPEQREAGTLYFHQNETKFKIYKPAYQCPRPHYKVCFDTEKDLKLISFILGNLQHPFTPEIINLLDNNPILAESNKYESIQEVGLEKLYFFPEKIRALVGGKTPGPDYTYPVSVELSLTNRCNFDCVWCSDKDLRARINGDIELEVIKRLLVDLKAGGTEGIVIEGGGEPTIHKGFSDVVNLSYDLGFGVGLITNGSIPIKRGLADKFKWIRVSLDASNAEEQRALKGNDGFERIMSNIKTLCSSKATVGIGYVVTSKNLGSLEALIIRLSNFGASYIQFRPVIDHPELESNVDISYLKKYETGSFSIIADGMRENVVEGNAGLPCKAHSLTTVIAADGGVYLCGRLNIYPWIKPIGNITDQSFADIWLGKERIRQAQMVMDAAFCMKHCPRCRLTKFNLLFHRLEKTKTRNFI
ncbi:MAG: radical SAM protein [Nitrospirae bacterium]|nr:radical SAM protein [Nitrospirota bacterium]